MASESGDAGHDIGLLGAESQPSAAGASSRRRIVLAVLLTTLFWMLVGGAWALFFQRPEPAVFAIQPPPATSTPLPTPTPGPVYVEVTGAVHSAGVYALPPGSRVEQAIAAAGGLTASADAGPLSLAQLVYDGQKLAVAAMGQEQPVPEAVDAGRSADASALASSSGAEAAPNGAATVNVNVATAEQLDALPGIGPVTAKAIVAYREANGPFPSIESLLEVKGIGEATLAKFRDLVTLQ